MIQNINGSLKYFTAGLLFALTTGATLMTTRGVSAEPDSPKIIADRIVVAINNIPYSQNQVEAYVNVKESLRDDAVKSQTVNGANWSQALEAFINDTAIHQEATKTSGFRPTREAVQKLRSRSERAAASAPQFKAAFDRLGIEGQLVEIEILKVSTVENFRRGRQSLNSKDKTTNWEDELRSRTTVRYFDDAKIWKQTTPRP